MNKKKQNVNKKHKKTQNRLKILLELSLKKRKKKPIQKIVKQKTENTEEPIIEDAPVKKAPAKKASVKKAPAKKASVKKAPAKKKKCKKEILTIK